MPRLSSTALLSLVLLAPPAFAQAPQAPGALPSTPAPAAAAPGTAGAGPANAMLAPVSGDIAKVIDPNSIPALRNILQPNTVVRYMGSEYGLKGYFVTNDQEAQIVYTTPDEQGFILGTVFSADGNPVTFLQLGRMQQTGFDVQSYVQNMVDFSSGKRLPPAAAAALNGQAANSTLTTGEKLLQEVNGASWIAYGPPAAPMISAFMDPDCSSCHEAFALLKPAVDSGKIYLRVVPVGVITNDSTPNAIKILSSPNPAEAWTSKTNGTPTPAPAAPNPKAEAAIKANNAIFLRWKLAQTPYFIYRSADNQIKVINDTPEDLNALLADMGVK